MSKKYQMTREENEYNEWKHRRSFGHKHLLEGYRDVIACYRGIAKEVGMGVEFRGLKGAISDLLLMHPKRKNYNPKAKISLIKGHLLKIDKLCNELSILHRELRQLKYEYGTPNRKEENETN